MERTFPHEPRDLLRLIRNIFWIILEKKMREITDKTKIILDH